MREAGVDAGVWRRRRTDANPDATTLRISVPEGRYSVLREPGWTLTRRDEPADAQIVAELVSENPAWLYVRAGARVEAGFALRVAGRTHTTG